MAKFHINGCNYIGTPRGYILLEADENIEEIHSLSDCEWYEDGEENCPKNGYKVEPGDTGWIMAFLPGDLRSHRTLWSGDTYNGRLLKGYYFNGSFYNDGESRDFPRVAPEELEERERKHQAWMRDFNFRCFQNGSMSKALAQQYAETHHLELPNIYSTYDVGSNDEEYDEGTEYEWEYDD